MARKIHPVSVAIEAIDRFSQPMRRMTSAMRQSMRPIRQLRGQYNATSRRMSAMTRNMRRFSQAATSAGRTMTASITAPVALLGASIVRTAGDFQLSINKLENLTTAGGATAAQVGQLTEKAKELGSTTQFSASQAAEAMNFLAMSGMSANEILGATPKVLELAAASGIELAESADIVSNIMSGYNKTATDLNHVNDVLVTGFQSSNTNLQMLGESFKKVGPIASSMKIPIEDTTKAIGLLGNAGIQAEDAGTALRNTLLRLVDPTSEAKKTLEKLKINKSDIIDEQGNVRSLTGVVKAMIEAKAGAQDMARIFGVRTGPAIMAAMNQGTLGIEKLDKRMNKASGSAKKAAETMQKGWVGAWNKLKSAWEGLQLAIADSGLLDFVTNLATKIAGFFGTMAKTNPALLKMGVILAALAATIGPIVLALGLFSGAIANLMAIWPALVTAFTFMKATLIPGLIAGMKALFVAMLTNPIGQIAIAIGLLIAAGWLLVENWDSVKKWFVKTFKFLQDLFSGKIGWILTAIFPFIGIPLKIIEHWDILKKWFVGTFDFLKDLFSGNVGWILTAIFPFIGLPFKIMEHWGAIKKFFINTWGFISKVFQENKKLIMSVLFPFLQIPSQIMDAWEVLAGFFSNLWGKVKEPLDKLMGPLKKGLSLVAGDNKLVQRFIGSNQEATTAPKDLNKIRNQAQTNTNIERAEIGVRVQSDRPGVSAEVIKNSGADLTLDQGTTLLGGAF